MVEKECTHPKIMTMPVVETRKEDGRVARIRMCKTCKRGVKTYERMAAVVVKQEQEARDRIRELERDRQEARMKLQAMVNGILVIQEITKEVGSD